MEYVSEWIKQISYYMVFVTLILNLVAGKSYQKYIRIFTGLILMLLILSPVTKLLSLDEEGMMELMNERYETAMKEIDHSWEALYPEEVQGIEDTGEETGEETGIEVEEIRIGR